MKVSYNWLKEYFKKLPPAEKLGEILNNHAYEVEGVEEVVVGDDDENGPKSAGSEKDFVLDIDVLPNRAHDSLCHYGIAREIATITENESFDVPEKIISESVTVLEEENKLQVSVETPSCRRYMAARIENVVIGESPLELRQKLQAIGARSINNIVDITNIVMFEIGQPMHAFDLKKLYVDTSKDGSGPKSGKSAKIIVRAAEDDEKMTTLDGTEVSLDSNDALITNEKNVLAIAGVKGGKIAEIDSTTRDIVLESANFVPTAVRKTSKKIGIQTDSSKRFENEITPALAERAILLATALIKKYASGPETRFYRPIDIYPRPFRNYRTGVSVREVNNLLGLNLTEKKIAKVLDRLNFKYEIVKTRDKIVTEARNQIGQPYKLGASVFYDAPRIFDCSSFVSYIYSCAGYSIPRVSIDQFVYAKEISATEVKPGDLIFGNSGIGKIHQETIDFLPGTNVNGGIDHVGICLGEEEVIHATNKNGVNIVSISNPNNFGKDVKYARIIEDETRFAVTVPAERLDIKTSTELIEEIGRVYGYENISDQKIELSEFSAQIEKNYALNNIIRTILIENGFSEVFTYSFTSNGIVSPEKPIAEDKKYLRQSLTEEITNALDRNIKNSDLLGLEKIKIFEIGKVFLKDENKNEVEKLNLCIGVLNKAGVKKPRPTEVLEDITKKISERIGFKIDTKISENQNIVEISLDEVYKNLPIPEKYIDLLPIENKQFSKISIFPFVVRDIAVWLPYNLPSEILLNLIKQEAGELLVHSKLFDTYTKEDKTSYAFRLVFQSYEKTLTDNEIGIIMSKIEEKCTKKGWEVR